jgi:hypothetical protein
MEFPRHRRAHAPQRPPGRALPDGGGALGDGRRDHAARAGRRRDHGRDHVPRQHHHEGLPEERQGHRGGVPRRLVPFRGPGGDAARRLREDQGPLEGHHHLRRREHLLARGRGRPLSPSRRDRRRGGGPPRRQVGRGAVRVRRAEAGRASLGEGDRRVLPPAHGAVQGAARGRVRRAAQDFERAKSTSAIDT